MDMTMVPDKAELLRKVRAGMLSPEAAIDLLKRRSRAAAPAPGPAGAADWETRFLHDLTALVAGLLRLEPAAVDLDAPVAEMGLDSLSATEFNNKMRARFGISLQATVFFECRTIRDFYTHMLRVHAKPVRERYAATPAAAAATTVAPPAAPAPALRPTPRPAGDPVRANLERVWRLAEAELDAGAPPAGPAPRDMDLDRFLLRRSGGPDIEVCCTGGGDPVLLLGGLMNPEGIWHNQIRALAARYRVVVFNKPGCGRSGIDMHRLSMDGIVDGLRFVLDSLNLRAPLPVLGFSFGGMVALALAATHPGRVAKLALINSTACPRPRSDEVRILVDEMARCPEVALINGDVDFAVAARYREVSRGFDIRSVLPGLPHPALVLSAGGDGYISRDQGVELAGLLPRARHVELAEAGHFSLLTHAEAVNRHLAAFLDADRDREAAAELRAARR